ncbi:MAG: tRNA (adenosine(37)-N6)-dimethylallyltransferase MiaA [Pseudomonadota bacterium]|nr:tRNA (adenosine(37)-N6)-dimethylallyltransferase MiaA [Pseudomonadota bacterium]
MTSSQETRRLIIVAGPTASGKSSLAIDLAENLNGLIVNADSMQVYRELKIVTSRPSPKDEAKVPHKLYGSLSAKEKCSAGLWRNMAIREIEAAWKCDKLPILVGGTGLYIKVLTEGISEVPPVSGDYRREAQSLYNRLGAKKFHAELRRVDTISADRISQSDSQRLTRAYEVYLSSKIPFSEWQNSSQYSLPIKSSIRTICLLPPRDKLYQVCNNRFETMLEMGAIDEVSNLMNMELDASLPATKAVGVKELSAYLRGEITLLEASDAAKQATRNYAKRQMTWFRNQLEKPELVNAQYSERIFDQIFSKIRF